MDLRCLNRKLRQFWHLTLRKSFVRSSLVFERIQLAKSLTKSHAVVSHTVAEVTDDETEQPSNSNLSFGVATNRNELKTLSPLVKELLAESRFSYFEFSPEKFEKLITSVEENASTRGVLVARLHNKPVGLVYCTAGGLAIADGPPINTVTMFFVEKGLRDTLIGGKIAVTLLAGLESWSKSRDCVEILFHANFGSVSERVHRFLKRRGFETVGGSYAKKID